MLRHETAPILVGLLTFPTGDSIEIRSHGGAVNKAIPRGCHDSGNNHCEVKCPGEGCVPTKSNQNSARAII